MKARLLSRVARTQVVLRGALWAKMPLLAMAGPRVLELDRDRCRVEIPFAYRNRNPFGSLYFAASLMAAEATTGLLVFFHEANRGKKRCSFIVTGVEADFVKSAKSDVIFTCEQGEMIEAAFREAELTKERVDRPLEVVGHRADGEAVARVKVRWYWRGR
jgi:acyl-coenzyme A thioesterase PaaI-like protein